MTFEQEIQELLAGGEAEALLQALGGEPTVSVRLNRTRPLMTALTGDAPAERVPWCDCGYYLDRRPAFTLDPNWHAGAYYVQDASSMFIAHVIRSVAPHEPLCYLDLCAAPGGKTTAAIDALPAGSLTVANEVMPARALALCDNVTKWGNPRTVVTNAQPREFARRLPAAFDIVAVDAPCSGEGMMRKDTQAVEQWSPALVRQCATLQRDILTHAWQALKPGGLLIYSTCTFNREENECQLEFIAGELGGEPVAVDTELAWNIAGGIDTPLPCYRFMPHRTRGEGLFMAVMRKPQGTTDAPRLKPAKPAKQRDTAALSWLAEPDGVQLATVNDLQCALPRDTAPTMLGVIGAVRTLQAGTPLLDTSLPKRQPHAALAYSTLLRHDAFARAAVDRDTALRYLRGEALTLPDAPRGDVLITHGGMPLGFARNLGSRANNLYPKPWRIRTTHT